jgi:hypothetical protein
MSSPALSKFLQKHIVPGLTATATRTKGKEGTRVDVENYPGQILRFDVDLHAKVLKGMHDKGEFANKDGIVLDKKYFTDLLIKFCKEFADDEEPKAAKYSKELKSGVSRGTVVKLSKEDFQYLENLKKQHHGGKYYAIIVRSYNHSKVFYTQGKAGSTHNLHRKLTGWEENYLGKPQTPAKQFSTDNKAGIIGVFAEGGKYENRFAGGFNQEIGHGHEEGGKQEGVASSGYSTMRSYSNLLASKEFQNADQKVKDKIIKSYSKAFKEYGVRLEQAANMDQKQFLKGFDLILTTQDATENRELKNTETDAITLLKNEMADQVENLESSLSLNQMINHFLMSSFQGNKYVKLNQKYKEKYRSKSKSKSVPLKLSYQKVTPIITSGVELSKKHIARKSLQKRGTRQKSSNRLNPLAMINMINKKLPGEVEKNMGLPGLESRTGRFASSAKVVNFTEGKKGTPTLDYTYQKNPYQVFEEGERGRNGWASTNRDPRRVIDRSIREVAKDLALARFNTRRI